MNYGDDVDRYFRRTSEPPNDQSTFTVHISFLATDIEHAIDLAEMYARGLNYLRVEVECFGARVSPAGDWGQSTEVFCMVPGPRQFDVCTDLAGHDGNHNGPGPTGSWGDADLPTVPDTIEGFDGPPDEHGT